MWHCEACGWNGETPALWELVGEGCGGVVWTLHVCPECGEEVYETVMPRQPPEPNRNYAYHKKMGGVDEIPDQVPCDRSARLGRPGHGPRGRPATR
jgi:hypothetical protein